MVVGGVCAHGATNLFRCGQYPLLEGLLAGVSAQDELQELAMGRGCLRDPRCEAGFGLRDACPNGIWPPAFPCAPAGAPESKPLCCAQPFLLPIQSLMQTSLQRSCPGTKKRMICIIRRFAFERKTGFEPAALSLGS